MLNVSMKNSKLQYCPDSNKVDKELLWISSVPGINLSKASPIARSKLDELILAQVMSICKKRSVEIRLDSEVKEWYNARLDAIEKIATEKAASDYDLPLSYSNKLRKYQRVDVRLLSLMKTAILGNDPGTGKTLDTIAYADLIQAKRILVVCPLSLIGNWRDEIKLWSADPDIEVIPPEGNYKRNQKINENLAKGKRWNIMNYALFQGGRNATTNEYKSLKKYPQLFKEDWDLVIVDEAHAAINPRTQLHMGLNLLHKKSAVYVTGSWMTKNHYDVYGLLKLIDPVRFRSRTQFLETFNVMEADPALKRLGHHYVDKPVAPRNKNLYKFMLTEYVIQRNKREVLPELPDVIYKTIPIQLKKKEREMYGVLEKNMISVIGDTLIINQNVISQQGVLRKFALDRRLVDSEGVTSTYVSPKLEAIQTILDNTDGAVIIFSTSKKFLHLIKDDIQGRKIAMITGDVPQDQRQQVKRDLDAGKIDCILGTTQAMGEGLNLQTANTVILCDKTYVPTDQMQAVSRVDRMGQKTSPVVYSLITEGTIEEYIEIVNQQRSDLIDEMTSMSLVLESIRDKYGH